MGVGKSMKIFTEAMQNTMKEGGFGSKIVTTAMGPFKWDDLQESWVNINNGFRMPNISMQDLLAYGYDSASDGGENTEVPAVCFSELTSSIGNKTVNVNFDSDWQSILNLSTPSGWSNSCLGYFYVYKGGSQTLAFTQLQFRYTIDGGTNWETYTPVVGINGPHQIMNVTPNVQFGLGADFDIQVKPTMTGGASFTNPTIPLGVNPEVSYPFYVISTNPQQTSVFTLSTIQISTSNSIIGPP